jgi:hypothetical protein
MTTVPVHVTGAAGAIATTTEPTVSINNQQYPLLPNQAARIINQTSGRDSVVIRAWGGNVFIGSAGVTTGTGFIVPDGTTLTLTAACDVWAVTGTTGTAVHTLSEHRDGLGR